MKLSYQDRMTVNKALYSIMVVCVTMVLSHIPVYGVDSSILRQAFQTSSFTKFTDALTGGALGQLTIGGFGVMSLIMAGIVLQLMSIIFPKLQLYRQEGEAGRILFERIQCWLAIAMTVIMSATISIVGGSSLFSIYGAERIIPFIEWIAGSVTIILLAQSVRTNGLGEGTMLLLAANIAQSVPHDVDSITSTGGRGWILILGVIVSIVLAINLQGSFANVKIQQTSKPISIMNTSGYIPIPVVMSSVMPIVYASSLYALPQLYATLKPWDNSAVLETLLQMTTQAYWFHPTNIYNIIGAVIYILMIVGLAIFASEFAFSPAEVAHHMREAGDVIPGIRPGEETQKYLDSYRKRLSVVSALLLIVIVFISDAMTQLLGLPQLVVMGTSLVILIATYWDMHLRITGLLRHLMKRYNLFYGVKN